MKKVLFKLLFGYSAKCIAREMEILPRPTVITKHTIKQPWVLSVETE